MKTAALRPALRAVATNCMATVDLPTPAGPSRSVVVPGREPAAEHRVEVRRRRSANELRLEPLVVLGRDQAGVDDDPALGDLVVVVALAEVGPADLGDVQPPPGPAVLRAGTAP